MQPEAKPAAVGKNFSENILLILLILLAAGITFRVFYRGAYRWQDDLVWQAGAAVLAGFWFGRSRGKNSWAFFPCRSGSARRLELCAGRTLSAAGRLAVAFRSEQNDQPAAGLIVM